METASLAAQAQQLIIQYTPGLVLAIITLIVGLWIIKVVTNVFSKGMEKSKIEVSLHKFLISLVSILLKILLVISVASMIGIQTTSFVAILGAAGLAVGLALQGSLANFAGGILVLLFKPFKVGDFIDAQGVAGTVKEIQVFSTIMKTPDNKTIIIPNGAISNGIITNFSAEATRRVDMSFGIGYDDDIQKTKDILNRLIREDQRIQKEPAPVVVLAELADSSVNFTVRVWAKASDYWGIYFDMQEKVKLAFDKEKISIPYPQQDLHIINYQTSH